MAHYQPKEEQTEQTKQSVRKIGYVAQRLDDQQTTPATKTDAETADHVITDWASF